MERMPARHVRIELINPDRSLLYAGEAIYRFAKPHPETGEPRPMIGVPDDSIQACPSAGTPYRIRVNGSEVSVESVYLERVSTCWWFVLEQRLLDRRMTG